MQITHPLIRPVFSCMSLCLFVVLLTGCASKQPVAEKQAVKAEVKAEKEGIGLNPLNWPWNPLAWEFKRAAEGEMELNPYYWSVNPMHWDYKEANYNFREKYNFKLGPMWVIKPPRELNPSQIVVVRQFGMAPAVPQVQESLSQTYETYIQQKDAAEIPAAVVHAELQANKLQMLLIDLSTGDVLFEDVDGRQYPSQIDPDVSRQLLDLTTDKLWLREKKVKLKEVGQDQWAYRALFQESASEYKPVLRNWVISETSVNADVPEVQKLLTRTFEVAYRAVHPLSEQVNLLK